MTVIDEVCSLLEARLRELDEEEKSLQKALKGIAGGSSQKQPGRPRGSRSAPQRRSSKPRRSRIGGTRSDHALAFIEKNPGSTVSQVAEKLKIQQNYVYRVLGDLVKDGKLKKKGKTFSVVS